MRSAAPHPRRVRLPTAAAVASHEEFRTVDAEEAFDFGDHRPEIGNFGRVVAVADRGSSVVEAAAHVRQTDLDGCPVRSGLKAASRVARKVRGAAAATATSKVTAYGVAGS